MYVDQNSYFIFGALIWNVRFKEISMSDAKTFCFYLLEPNRNYVYRQCGSVTRLLPFFPCSPFQHCTLVNFCNVCIANIQFLERDRKCLQKSSQIIQWLRFLGKFGWKNILHFVVYIFIYKTKIKLARNLKRLRTFILAC